jgi:hypothetical protein
MSGKYDLLSKYLREQEKHRVVLSFDEIEKIIGNELPPSASKHVQWWENSDTHVEGKSWLYSGWLIENVGNTVSAREVILVKNDS